PSRDTATGLPACLWRNNASRIPFTIAELTAFRYLFKASEPLAFILLSFAIVIHSEWFRPQSYHQMQPRSEIRSRNRCGARVDFPAPFGPAMMTTFGIYGFSLYSIRGNGMVSRTCSMPHIQAVHRSMPIPKPA